VIAGGERDPTRLDELPDADPGQEVPPTAEAAPMSGA
jgi:hypothetical protein